MIIVEVNYQSNLKADRDFALNKAIRKFNRKKKDSKLMLEIDKHKYFIKKSDKKRRKKN